MNVQGVNPALKKPNKLGSHQVIQHAFIVCSEPLTFNIVFQGSNGSRCQLPKQLRKANEMKTDFKVKKVQMPAQNALEEKGEEVTHRKFLSLSWDLVWVENPGKVVYKLIFAYMFA